MSGLFQASSDIDVKDVRHEVYDGRPHLVVPVVAVVEGVLNGEYVSIELFEETLDAWDEIPVPMGHPTENGEFVPVLQAPQDIVGHGKNWSIENGAMKGEFWIDLNKAAKHPHGGDLLRRINKGTAINVSTAYFREVDPKIGEVGGEPFSGVQKDIIPDHVAVLLDIPGACNLNDGCGIRSNSLPGLGFGRIEDSGEAIKMSWNQVKPESITEAREQANQEMQTLLKQANGSPYAFVASILSNTDGLSDRDRRKLLQTQLSEVESDAFLVDVFSNSLVYEKFSDGQFRLYEREFGIDGDSDVTFGDPVEVRQMTSYEPVTNHSQEEHQMDRDELIAELASNSDVPFSAEALAAMDDCGLRYLAKNAGVEVQESEDDEEEVVVPASAPVETASPATAPNTGVELDEGVVAALNSLGADGIKAVLLASNAHATELKQKRAALISRLAANENVQLTQGQLESWPEQALEALDRAVSPADYSARAGVPFTNLEDSGPPPPPPVLLAPTAEA